jgi:flagellar hook-associated protein FlgK
MALGAFLGLDIGKKGVVTHQNALNVVSHNIANAQAKGYTRQTVSLKATPALDAEAVAMGTGQIGTGVTIGEIQRIRDEFIDEEVRKQKSFGGFVDSLAKSLGQLQTIINEPSDNNVRSAVDLFFQSLEDLNNQPESASVRVTVVERAKSLASFLNFTATKLTDEQKSVNLEVEQKVNRVNSIARTLSNLNGEIKKVEGTRQNPNDILDARDLLLDELAGLVNIDIRKDSTQTLFVRVDEHLLLQGEKVNELKFIRDPARKDGLKGVSTTDFHLPPSTNPHVADVFVGADAQDVDFALTVFNTANNHQLQSEALIDIRNNFQIGSSLDDAGITSGSFFINGVQVFFDNTDTLSDLRDEINGSGLGVSAFFERGRLVMNSIRTGTANKVVLSEGTSNIMDVMRFNDDRELDEFANVIFDGRVHDAKYAVGNDTFLSSSNFIEDVQEGVDVILKEDGSTQVRSKSPVHGGSLQGLLEYQDRYLDAEIRNLDKLAYALVTEFNKIHYEGFGLDDRSQRVFFQDFKSPDPDIFERGAARILAVSELVQTNPSAVAAAKGVFLKEGDKVPVSSGSGDGRNALKLAQLKFAKIIGHTDFGLATRLSALNGGDGVDIGRDASNFTISDGEKTAVVSLEGFNSDSTLFDLQNKINEALELNGLDSNLTLSPQADGTLRMISSNKNLTFSEGSGNTGSDLHITVSSGATGNGTRMIETSDLRAKFKDDAEGLIDFYAGVVADIGVRAQETLKLQENVAVVSTQLENERLAISGVSVDEELTNMIQFQQGFNASARIINTMSQVLEQVVNLGR